MSYWLKTDWLPTAAVLTEELKGTSVILDGSTANLKIIACISLLKLQNSKFQLQGDFFLYILYSTLLHLMPLRFHCVGGCWIEPTTVATLALAARFSRARSHPQVRLDLIHTRLDLIHNYRLLNNLSQNAIMSRNIRISFKNNILQHFKWSVCLSVTINQISMYTATYM